MKSQWFKDEHRKQFAKHLTAADYALRPDESLRTFLEMASLSLLSASKRFCGQCVAETEESYQRAAQSLRKPTEMSNAFAVLVYAVERHAYDFLGTFMGELGAVDTKYSGQCFTPHALAEITAEMTMNDLEKPEGRALRIDEPASGPGGMVIAAANVLKRKKFGPYDFVFRATDVARKCWQACFIQTTLLDIPCLCINGNTLSLQTYQSAWNLPALMRGHHITCGQ